MNYNKIDIKCTTCGIMEVLTFEKSKDIFLMIKTVEEKFSIGIKPQRI